MNSVSANDRQHSYIRNCQAIIVATAVITSHSTCIHWIYHRICFWFFLFCFITLISITPTQRKMCSNHKFCAWNTLKLIFSSQIDVYVVIGKQCFFHTNYLSTETHRNRFGHFWIQLVCVRVAVFIASTRFNEIPKNKLFYRTACMLVSALEDVHRTSINRLCHCEKSINISLQIVEQSSVMYEKTNLSTETRFYFRSEQNVPNKLKNKNREGWQR